MDYEQYMEKALTLAKRALADNEFPVGCIIVGHGKILAEGHRTHSTGHLPNETDHAEMNALRQLSLDASKITDGPLTVFSTMEPCLMCFGALLINGIHNIVYGYEDVMGGGTSTDLSRLSPLYREPRINIVPNILREESLKLFKAFFKNPQNGYWKESLLARYTLNQ